MIDQDTQDRSLAAVSHRSEGCTVLSLVHIYHLHTHENATREISSQGRQDYHLLDKKGLARWVPSLCFRSAVTLLDYTLFSSQFPTQSIVVICRSYTTFFLFS